MNHFEYKDEELFCEDVKVADLAAEYGTPLYVYCAATIRRHFLAFDGAFAGLKHLTCYSVKANSNIHIIDIMGQLGGGVDIVSGGELYRALKAKIPGEHIVYSGVGKRSHEIREALEANILMFNVESLQELELIGKVAEEMGRVARVSFRINPDVDPKTHPYISTGMKNNKFGLDMTVARIAYKRAQELSSIDPIGMDCHIGSQLTQIEPFLEALQKLLDFMDELNETGLCIKYLDLGGGLGIQYDDETPPHPEEFAAALRKKLEHLDITVIFEPGRVIVGNTGILVTEVLYTKQTTTKNFVIVDAAMNDLIRPALYESFHRITPAKILARETLSVDVVGPICESSDFLARDRQLPVSQQGELLVAHSAGAYGFTMSSNYNSRPRAAEILVDGDQARLIRRRETYQDLIGPEEF